MSSLTKKVLFLLIFTFFTSISISYAQSENEKIDDLIEQKRTYNKNNKSSVVYKIQLYNGNEEEAYKIRRNFNTSYPEYKTTIIYKPPEWKTQVGNFKTRLEADRALNIIKEKFAGAIVLLDKI
jgi:hypothetical protein